ncbi:FtsB family cell division protein [Lutibaculum baratangense]|uniref:Uncharacterized protein n=1 Tax=Lutibaculum baratangense AMV1 TaxID=631454 RepID=V4R3D0_9HYPH|nr:hypothetical protein [Lutibaculum baratangense]ESR26422.1 hypothetical protein N177_0922 [Lutibaculum baratangense AMV1]
MRSLVALSAFLALLVAPAVLAQEAQPDTEGGRYMLREVDGGYLRVDRDTGDTSICRGSGAGWTCTLVADDRRAYEDELERLAAENAELADRVASLRDEVARLRGGDATTGGEAGEGKRPRPSSVATTNSSSSCRARRISTGCRRRSRSSCAGLSRCCAR